jgi:hypothetical protein
LSHAMLRRHTSCRSPHPRLYSSQPILSNTNTSYYSITLLLPTTLPSLFTYFLILFTYLSKTSNLCLIINISNNILNFSLILTTTIAILLLPLLYYYHYYTTTITMLLLITSSILILNLSFLLLLFRSFFSIVIVVVKLTFSYVSSPY